MRKIIPYHTILNDQGIIIDKKKQNHTAKYINIDKKNIKTSSSIKLLGVHIDNKLNFNLHITKICRSVANQLFALSHLNSATESSVSDVAVLLDPSLQMFLGNSVFQI